MQCHFLERSLLQKPRGEGGEVARKFMPNTPKPLWEFHSILFLMPVTFQQK